MSKTKVLDYKGNEIDNLLAYGVRNGKGYDFVIPTHHALKQYTQENNPDVVDEEELDDLYHETLRHAALFNLDD